MSCGLGAIILVFMLVKHNVDNSSLEVELLTEDLQRLEEIGKALHEKITETETKNETIVKKIETVSGNIEQIRIAIAKTKKEISSINSKRSSLEESIKTTEIPEKSDVVDDPQIGEENYIIGLRVEGRRIAILLDSSSSMTDEILIDVIRRKNSSSKNKMAGPKWQRAKRIVQWLLERAPVSSDVSVVSFNKKASHLGGKGWKGGGDPVALGRVFSDLDVLVPEGSTNLQAGLKFIAQQKPTDIYLITDGLPTDGDSGYKSLNPFADCAALWGGSSTITGECRVKLFQHTINSVKLPGVSVNVILLPIEGDPDASKEFWLWTSMTNGLLISPAESWP
jgi:hypothetical protein